MDAWNRRDRRLRTGRDDNAPVADRPVAGGDLARPDKARLRAHHIDPERGDCHFPAVLRRGDLLLTVSTGGVAPALARRIKERLAAEFDEAFGEWVEVLAEMRALAQRTIDDDMRRSMLLDELAGWDWLERLRKEGRAMVEAAMRTRSPAAVFDMVAAACARGRTGR